MNDALELMKRRRSIRQYTAEPLSPEHVRALLEAAMAAPSGNNAQPWEFVVVADPEVRRALARTHRWSGMAGQAPVVFVVCGREPASIYWNQDCSAATENLLLEATALGLGAVWVAVYPTPEFEAHVRRTLDLPADVRPLCLVAIGHPAEERPARTQYQAARVHYDRYGQRRPS